MNHLLVSVIVTTKNNHATLDACLKSIKQQSYQAIELIVVDNSSTDDTQEIARRYTKQVYTKGPDRSAQRNLAVEKSKGTYVVIIDSDMELSSNVIKACVERIESKSKVVAVTIPEESFGVGFWAKCKALERSYYIGVDWIEYPRFMSKATFIKTGGYDPTLAGAEDWDFNERLKLIGDFGRITPVIRHNEGRLKLSKLLRKRMYYYGEGYTRKADEKSHSAQSDGLKLLARFYALYFSRPLTILRHPIKWCGMMLMRTLEFGARATGLIKSRMSV